MTKKYRAVLLDIDGTLIVSNEYHAEAWAQALTECGHPATTHGMLPLIGMGGDQIIPLVTGLPYEGERGQAIATHRKTVFKDVYLKQIPPVRGAAEAVWALMAKGVPVTVVSSAAAEELTDLLKIGELEDLAQDAVVAEGSMPSKPEPTLLLKALQQMRYDPAEVVMLGDTEYDIEAARRAGIDCVAVRTGGRSDSTLAGAVAIFDTVVEALAADIFAVPAQPRA